MENDRPTWRSRVWLAVGIVILGLALLLMTIGVDDSTATWSVALVAAGVTAATVGWALAQTRGQRRQYEAQLAEWAAERARQTERLRIAGDLHDLVSHGLGLITVRATTARTAAGSEGEADRTEALADIERVSRETTTELRRMLTVLRTPGTAPLRPADTLDDLPEIVQAANAAGLDAALGIDELGEASPGAQLTICAVVREALNNTLRHVGPTQARIDIHREREAIVVNVQDAGPAGPWHPHPGAGHGLDGLRERVTTLGGELHTGTEGRGFTVTARIPDREGS
ncbi:sensor histidine kinase [Micromonospora sp. MW-13]|uniref:sensor histidine kinase n=1 Tax=Micromonospora sp. MW-13 TaxID=2094022 RepID=UPI000E448EC3|nr:histidine kinase [Micromonospora sp. MW-13]